MRILLSLVIFVSAAVAAERPNLVFILADDFRWDALGCQGNAMVHSPHLDRLAARGVRFTQSFVTTSICSVSRATFFSGQYARRHGIEDFQTAFTPERWRQTYPALLRAAGYRTGFVGKFGVGGARSIAAMAGQFDYWRGLPGQGGEWFIDPGDPTRTHSTAKFGEEALEFLRAQEVGRPFCLSVSFSAVHARDGKPREFQPDPRDEGLYADVSLPMPRKATDAFFQLLPEVAQKSEGRARWMRRFATPEMAQATMRDYYRLVTGLDREVGRMIEEVKARGLAGNTWFIFTGDNGFFLGDRGLADKWLMYEESIRVPLIVAGPGAESGRTVDALALNIDLAPTLLDLAGVPAPATMQGRSLVPWLRGESAGDWRSDFFYEHHSVANKIPPTEGVRTTRWKYTRWLNAEPLFEELFDLAADPEELRNLAAEPDHRARLEELRARWTELAAGLR